MRETIKKNSKKVSYFMKLKYYIVALILLVGTLFGLVFYYELDPSLLAKISFYINLANPNVHIVKVHEGLRKEQVAEIMANKLGWDESEKDSFLNAHIALNSSNLEGRYFPKTYLIDKNDTPAEVSTTMFEEFSKQTDKIRKSISKEKINEDTAIKIASIIQREAGGKSDMKLISGIIWNRIFSGMKLQMDATLQYAKGSEEEGWWGRVRPEDKKIDSSYNTYMYEGFPPGAIANPGIDAITAAYNPQKTNCMFYLHDKNRKIHCAVTYDEHKRNIEKYY